MSTRAGRTLLFSILSMWLLSACDVAPPLESPAPATSQGPPVSEAKRALKGDCAHDMCREGSPLTSTCAKVACLNTICIRDPYCCEKWWDDICVGHVQDFCPTWTCSVR